MSNYVTYTDPINIPTKKQIYSNNNYEYPSFENPKFLFELELKMIDGNKKVYRKIEQCNECNLIENNENIKFSNLKSFRIVIIELSSSITKFYNMEDIFNSSQDVLKKTTKEIHIEFFKNEYNNFCCFCKLVCSSGVFGISPN
jgi:hypothetical protein